MNVGPYTIGSDTWPGMSKLQEEMSELGVVLAKIQSLNGDTDYWRGRDLRTELVDEIGDVAAAVEFFVTHNLTGAEQEILSARRDTKLDRFNRWRRDYYPTPYPDDGGLKEQVRDYKDTQSAFTVMNEHFFRDESGHSAGFGSLSLVSQYVKNQQELYDSIQKSVEHAVMYITDTLETDINIKPEDLLDDIGLDSLDMVEVIMALEEEHPVTFPENLTQFKTIQSMAHYIFERVQ